MKNLLFSLVFLLTLSVFQQAHAQFGLRTGISVSNFDGFDFESRVGFHGGLYYGLPLRDKVTLEPAILYSQKGYKSSATSTAGAFTENINYVDIPVLVRYAIIEKLNVFAGPQASLLASRKRENSDGTVSRTTDVVRGYDLAGIIGVAVSLPKGVNFQTSYDFGLTSLNYFNFNVKNRVLKFAVGKNF